MSNLMSLVERIIASRGDRLSQRKAWQEAKWKEIIALVSKYTDKLNAEWNEGTLTCDYKDITLKVVKLNDDTIAVDTMNFDVDCCDNMDIIVATKIADMIERWNYNSNQ